MKTAIFFFLFIIPTAPIWFPVFLAYLVYFSIRSGWNMGEGFMNWWIS